MEVTTHETTKSEAKELYNELIKRDIDALEGEKSNEKIISWIISIM